MSFLIQQAERGFATEGIFKGHSKFYCYDCFWGWGIKRGERSTGYGFTERSKSSTTCILLRIRPASNVVSVWNRTWKLYIDRGLMTDVDDNS